MSPLLHGDPAAWFAEVAATHARCFWLDGGGARDWSGSRSLVGALTDDDVSITYDAACREVTRHVGGVSTVVASGDDADVFAVLEAEIAAGAEAGRHDQWFGYFGYACRPDLPARPDCAEGGAGLPDAIWMRPSLVREFVHDVTDPAAAAVTVPTAASDRDVPEEYADAFARVAERLRAGDTYEANLTHRVSTSSEVSPPEAYARLRALNPAPYAGFLQHDVDGARGWLLSSSPERYALITADAGGRVIETKPIKGTTPRGATPIADAEQKHLLATDPKFRAENLMIVDLLRNDLGAVCEVGSVEVPALMQVESYASVHQLVSTVRGRLREDLSTVGALRSLFPAGSMTGAPKLRTMQITDAVEATPRGVYAGAFGWISGDGRADLGVVIRSLVTTGDGTWTLGTGGGITVRSDVVEEWAETAWKAERLLRVFDA
ncbi:anthranilate synthase component I family protein [Nocardioides yefusunii]|uniref:Anthranilate synthase component I family protein n=1 Tax=Nocardioides yefusunii TaxID=2500546 RepID=A0ABW1QXQ7_9ACTN|nr:anthranilate synthase component I family protein [Nocardioides yefusunii]